MLNASPAPVGHFHARKTRSLPSIQLIGGADIIIGILALHHFCLTLPAIAEAFDCPLNAAEIWTVEKG
jgi:hypothetical protein